MQLSREQIYALAPDGKSAQAGEELARDGAFQDPRTAADGNWLEALCQGSDPRPYHVGVDLDANTVRCGCDCMSRKYPCKHALGLLWLRRDDRPCFQEGEISAGFRQQVRAAAVGLTLPATVAARIAKGPNHS